MHRASQIVILCEDHAHEIFVRRFLTKVWEVPRRVIRLVAYPRGKGSGKAHVADNLAKEVVELRKRPANTILIAMQDVDEFSFDEQLKKLEESISPARVNDEPIALILPKWNIQTWIAFLDTKSSVDEHDKNEYTNRYRDISESKAVHSLVDELAELCRKRISAEHMPASLLKACEEFERIRSLLPTR